MSGVAFQVKPTRHALQLLSARAGNGSHLFKGYEPRTKRTRRGYVSTHTQSLVATRLALSMLCRYVISMSWRLAVLKSKWHFHFWRGVYCKKERELYYGD